MSQQNNDQINALPEYEVRTMKDDLNKVEGRAIQPKLVNLKVPEIQVPKPSIKIDEPPKELPIVDKIEKPTEPTIKTFPKQSLSEEIDNILNAPGFEPKPEPKSEIKPSVESKTNTPEIVTPKITINETKKSSLPDIEDFIVPAPPVPPPAPTPKPKPLMPVPPITEPISIETTKFIKSENNEIERTIKTHKTKKILTILGIIIIVGLIAGLGYWLITKPRPTEPEPPVIEQPETPASLIRVDETKVFKMENNSSLVDILINEENSGQPEKTLKRIVPTKINGKALSLNELIQELQIYIPPYTLGELNKNYTLVAYKQGNQQRLGLIIEIKNLPGFIEKSRSWENTMTWNFQGIFLNHQPNNLTVKGFSDYKYNEINVRFVNLAVPELSIDYAILNNLFVVSTSRESMRNIIDRLK